MGMKAGRMARMALVIGAAATVAACSTSRREVGAILGMGNTSPNPFNVYPRGRLALPEDLESLPAPRPGEPSPLEPTPQRDAQAALGNSGAAPAGAAASAGEAALLANAGAAEARPDIREALEQDDAALRRERKYGFTTFFGYKVPDGSEEDQLEAREERKRLLPLGAVTPTPPPEEEEDPGKLF